jgi:two-component system sensor histidine kinase BaeS
MSSLRVPLHRSLIVRLLATSVLVAIGAIAATAWLTVKSTTQDIQRQQGRSLADDNTIYDTLVGYAATHPRWDGVTPVVTRLSARTGRRVTLLTQDRRVIADSASGPALLSERASATVDPLHVNTLPSSGDSTSGGTVTASSAGGIDARAVGPYRLTATERTGLGDLAEQALICMSKDPTSRIVISPNGRPVLTPAGSEADYCMQESYKSVEDLRRKVTSGLRTVPLTLWQPTATEARALKTLTTLTSQCMGRSISRYVEIEPLFRVQVLYAPLPGFMSLDKIQRCLQVARRKQLQPYVAPAALLFVTDPQRGTPQPSINLSRRNVLRIAAGTGLVLAVAILITVLAGLRLVRPLRRLADAARRPIDQQQHVTVGTRDEIGYLAIALNDLTQRREELEAQRKALVSDVAHELRTPLTNIRSWLEAAQDGMTPADPQFLDLLLDETVLLQHIIDDLRDLAAADAGTLRLYPDFLYVNDVLAQVLEAHRGAAEAGGVRLSNAFTTDLQMLIDPLRLRQIVGNLVSNAIRHTARGGLVVVRTSMAGEDLLIDVADTGSGIEAANLHMVFDRFWRADGSRSRATGGSGLGLSIARKLVEAHDGTISVTSKMGVGSTFTVRLPRSRQAPPPSVDQEQPADATRSAVRSSA